MASTPPTVVGTIEHAATPIVTSPHEAQIVDGAAAHIRQAVSVTEKHGLQIETIDEHENLPFPYRASGTRTVIDVESFLNELSRHPLDEIAGTLWGSAQRGVLTAIYNDHTGEWAGWRDDQLRLELQQDADWVAWHALSGVFHTQNDFGDKIEELLHTITDPDQADLLEVIDSVRASTSGEFNSQIERANGGQKLIYNVQHDVKAGRSGQLEIPQTVTLSLRPWENHANTYDVGAYFRVRINDGALKLAIKLKPTSQIVRQAWTDLTTTITTTVGKPVHAVK